MRVDIEKECIYFVKVGWFTNSMAGYYEIAKGELVIIQDGYLPQIVKYFRKCAKGGETTIHLTFFN